MPFSVSLLSPTTFPHIDKWHSTADQIHIRSRPVSSFQASSSSAFDSKNHRRISVSDSNYEKGESVVKDSIMEDYAIPIQPRKNSAYLQNVMNFIIY